MAKIPAPPKDKLENLYLEQRLTTRQIGKLYGVSKHPVEDWLHKYGIPTRPKGTGLDNRGIEAPTAEELYRLVHIEHESYKAIARRYGVDYTAIPHWLTKHGIPKPKIWDTRRKGKSPQLPDKSTLEHLYLTEKMSTVRIGQQYGASASMIANLCRSLGIPLRANGFNGGVRFECSDGHLVRSTYEQRVDEWLTAHGVAHIYEPVLPFDRRSKADFYANGYFIEVWGVTNSRRYKERADRKRRLYALHNLPLIEIPVHAFNSQHKGLWKRRLRRCLTNPQAHEPALRLWSDSSSRS